MTHKRRYRMILGGSDNEALALLQKRVPRDWDRLGPAREMARCIRQVFPNVKVDVASVQTQADVGVMKRL